MTSVANRLDWFTRARFGLFVHWGLYSLIGRGEWVMSRERIPWSEYEPLADRFTAEKFDPRAWARLARQVGMKYVVLTTKHHEGFCLWDSKVCTFNSVNRAAKRDIVAEFVDAVRSEGLKVGLYYSLGDWRNPDWFRGWQGDAAARIAFVQWTHDLVRELVSNYGRIDLLFYDLPQCYTATQWRSVELNAMVRALQPHIVINNRSMTTEDYATPEQHAHPSDAGRPWECCMTLNDHWGYCPSDTNYKTARTIALTLAHCASFGGNLLLNVGPDGCGEIPQASVKILQEVGHWLAERREAIFDTDRNPLHWFLFGPTTVKDHAVYCFPKYAYGDTLCVGGLKNKVLSVKVLGTEDVLAFRQTGQQTIISGMLDKASNPVLPVIRLQLDGPPADDLSETIGGADIFPVFPA